MTNQSNLQTAEEILNANKPYGRNWSEFLLPDQMEFLYRAMESYASQSLPQPETSEGLRWVKAVENLAGWILRNKNTMFLKDVDISHDDKKEILQHFGYSDNNLF